MAVDGHRRISHPPSRAVFITETNFDRLLDARGTPVAGLSRQGEVEPAGVPVIWTPVPRSAWEEAWSMARASCITGTAEPSQPRRAAQA